MMVKPTVAELLKKADNRYELVIATSKRARQIASGDKPMTKVKEESAVTLAVNEIAEGKVVIEREGEEPKDIGISENEIAEENSSKEDAEENLEDSVEE
jgi:DNA-directed RNA polymerase subunit omega